MLLVGIIIGILLGAGVTYFLLASRLAEQSNQIASLTRQSQDMELAFSDRLQDAGQGDVGSGSEIRRLQSQRASAISEIANLKGQLAEAQAEAVLAKEEALRPLGTPLGASPAASIPLPHASAEPVSVDAPADLEAAPSEAAADVEDVEAAVTLQADAETVEEATGSEEAVGLEDVAVTNANTPLEASQSASDVVLERVEPQAEVGDARLDSAVPKGYVADPWGKEGSEATANETTPEIGSVAAPEVQQEATPAEPDEIEAADAMTADTSAESEPIAEMLTAEVSDEAAPAEPDEIETSDAMTADTSAESESIAETLRVEAPIADASLTDTSEADSPGLTRQAITATTDSSAAENPAAAASGAEEPADPSLSSRDLPPTVPDDGNVAAAVPEATAPSSSILDAFATGSFTPGTPAAGDTSADITSELPITSVLGDTSLVDTALTENAPSAGNLTGFNAFTTTPPSEAIVSPDQSSAFVDDAVATGAAETSPAEIPADLDRETTSGSGETGLSPLPSGVSESSISESSISESSAFADTPFAVASPESELSEPDSSAPDVSDPEALPCQTPETATPESETATPKGIDAVDGEATTPVPEALETGGLSEGASGAEPSVVSETLDNAIALHRAAADASPEEARQLLQPLSLLAQDGESAVRREAIEALGKLRSPQALPYLRQGLRDSDPDVVQAASDAIAPFKGYRPKAAKSISRRVKRSKRSRRRR